MKDRSPTSRRALRSAGIGSLIALAALVVGCSSSGKKAEPTTTLPPAVVTVTPATRGSVNSLRINAVSSRWIWTLSRSLRGYSFGIEADRTRRR